MKLYELPVAVADNMIGMKLLRHKNEDCFMSSTPIKVKENHTAWMMKEIIMKQPVLVLAGKSKASVSYKG